MLQFMKIFNKTNCYANNYQHKNFTYMVIIHKYVCERNDYIIREMIWGHCQGKGQQIPTEKLALTPQIKQHLSISLMLLCG